MCEITKKYIPENNPIYSAVKKRNIVLLKKILTTVDKDELNDKRLTDKSALDLAAEQGDSLATKLLLDHGAKPDFNRPMSTWWESTLGRAIRSKSRQVIKLLIDEGGCDPDHTLKIDFTQQNYYRNSPYNCWYSVVEQNDLPIFKYLLTCTKRQIGNDEWSQMLLLTACDVGSIAIVTYLLDQGVSIDYVGGIVSTTGIFYALFNRHIDIYQLLVARNANLKLTDGKGMSLLHVAANMNLNVDIIRQLLDKGLDVNLPDNSKRTPLHFAVTSNTQTVELLLERGGDVNAVDKFGRTPIHTTIINKFIDYRTKYNTFNLLFVQKNINLMQADVEGIMVLHSLAYSDNQSHRVLRNVMLRPEVNINARDNNGETPFDYYIKNGRFLEIFLFVDFGADTKILKKHKDYLWNNRIAMDMLACLNVKRSVAGFEKDPNIEAVLDNQKNTLQQVLTERFVNYYSSEIELMKATPLLGNLTYFDFLHAKRRTCIAIASKAEMRNIFVESTHNYIHYSNMLCQKYASGLVPLNEVEIKALNDAEDNINFLLNYRLPSLVVHQIKEYINIEDMVTLQSMNLFECDDM